MPELDKEGEEESDGTKSAGYAERPLMRANKDTEKYSEETSRFRVDLDDCAYGSEETPIPADDIETSETKEPRKSTIDNEVTSLNAQVLMKFLR